VPRVGIAFLASDLLLQGTLFLNGRAARVLRG
jgi:hypothetical protein